MLKDGSLGILDDEWLVQYGGLIKHGKVDKKSLRVGRWMVLGGQLDTDKKVIKKEWWKKWNDWQNEDDITLYNLPEAWKYLLSVPISKKDMNG